CLKSRTINSALNEDAKNVCGALNICTKSLRIVKSHASALIRFKRVLLYSVICNNFAPYLRLHSFNLLFIDLAY
ncbi:hypothetical protein, partial [uncultured Duncaniella sp.]|uniref:hypothetical protein n=1 Tax=uncultured Duncaniella sp. TaxID=2768039 RepID=UPI0026E09106